MNGMSKAMAREAVGEFRTKANGQVVLVLQGGGALGAYQAGVYQALHEAGVEPDWIVGTSIGAINAAIIAGNKPQDRLERLNTFWTRMEQRSPWSLFPAWTGIPEQLTNFATMTRGIEGFFTPNVMAFMGQQVRLCADNAGYYST